MAAVDLIAGAMITAGSALMLVGLIGLALTRAEEREEEMEHDDADD